MKIMNCPLNGPRNIQEFVWMGDVKRTPGSACTDREWTDYLFIESNIAGAHSNYLFVARRNTLSDEILWTKTTIEYFADDSK